VFLGRPPPSIFLFPGFSGEQSDDSGFRQNVLRPVLKTNVTGVRKLIETTLRQQSAKFGITKGATNRRNDHSSKTGDKHYDIADQDAINTALASILGADFIP